jgi:hypothetical protein
MLNAIKKKLTSKFASFIRGIRISKSIQNWPPKLKVRLMFDPTLKAINVVALIKASQINKTPLSIIRLGNGESAVIGFPEFTPKNEFLRNLKVFFGKNKLSREQQHNFVKEVRLAVRHADVVGVVGGVEVNKFTVVRYFLDYYELIESEAKIANLSLHRNLQEEDLFKSFMQDLDEIGVITCRDVADLIKEHFNIKNVLVYKIPEEAKFASDKDTVQRHYPERFEEIRATLKVNRPGMLFLVGAGPLGKVYCRWIKEMGGIALDVGSIFDSWAGLKTRKFMENANGNINDKYFLKK